MSSQKLEPNDDEPTAREEFPEEALDFPEDVPPEELERLLREEPTVPGVPRDLDTYEDSKQHELRNVLPAAPEVSGQWRERAFAPRSALPKEQILSGLDRALRVAAMHKGSLEKAWTALRAEWKPLLRQAVEQAGGDGLDGYLSRLLSPPGTRSRNRLVEVLGAAFARMHAARDARALAAEGRRLIEVVRSSLESATARAASLEYLEKQLDGRLDVDDVLSTLFSSGDELSSRLAGVERTIESLRSQLMSMPGAQPEALLSNFARLKLERRLYEAERARRGTR